VTLTSSVDRLRPPSPGLAERARLLVATNGGFVLLAVLGLFLLSAGIEDARTREIANWKNAAIALLAPLWWWSNGLALWPDMAFQLAGRLAMHEGLPQCQPVLLEPIYQVDIVCPSEATAKMNALMSGHRGQILGFDTRDGWNGWDIVKVQMPEAEIGNLIIEVRSATAGVGSFTFKFDHMAELTGRTADQIIAARKAAAAA